MTKANLDKQFAEQLESIIQSYKDFRARARYDDLSDVVDEVTVQAMITRSRSAIIRVAGATSAYNQQAEDILRRPVDNDWGKMTKLIGVVASLQADLQAGYLKTLQELVHGEVFADFLEMADYLLGEGYKDASAVIAGGALEVHLRCLCIKNGVALEVITSRGTQQKKTDQMNADLAKEAVYSVLDQKNVTAWLDLRNKAAHGRYAEYVNEQVALLVQGVREFITRNSA